MRILAWATAAALFVCLATAAAAAETPAPMPPERGSGLAGDRPSNDAFQIETGSLAGRAVQFAGP